MSKLGIMLFAVQYDLSLCLFDAYVISITKIDESSFEFSHPFLAPFADVAIGMLREIKLC